VIVGIEEAARWLGAGGVVAYPTETVYGLGTDALSAEAVARLRELKGRGADQGLSILVAGLADLQRWALDLPERAVRLARAFWPGPLTLVVAVRPGELSAVETPDGVGFRCSPQPSAAALVLALGRPLVTTSANRSGEPPCRSAREVAQVFGGELPIAGGEDAGGAPPSTVVAVARSGELRILREGPIRAQELLTIG
jgi:L-threonylcarbamoyladenylate synthase